MKRKAKNLGLKKPDASQLDQREMIKHLESLGFKVAKHAPITDKLFNLDTERYNGENVKIGIVSDTHLGSNHQQLTHLKTIYQRFADEGIKIVLHAGDICQGINMYPGWYQETFLHNFDRQAEYIIKHYPKHPGMKTYVILGNHCESFLKSGGGNICKYIAERRDDIVHLGDYGAYITLPGGLLTYLHHGDKGCSYARSYKLQKFVEQFKPGKRPRLYIVGHYHVACMLPGYQNCYSLLAGCFQGQSLWLRRKGIAPAIGGYILDYMVNPNSKEFELSYIRSEWIPFREEMANDY